MDHPDQIWRTHETTWRDPLQIVAAWEGAEHVDPHLLRYRVTGDFWGALDQARTTLLVSREYEHLVIALSVSEGRPYVTFLPMPHPSGIAFNSSQGLVHIASTRNPNRVLDFAPVRGTIERGDSAHVSVENKPLAPLQARFYPGALYLHDLVIVDGELCAAAAGENAVVRFETGGYTRAWWPKAIERAGVPDHSRNYLQLNSIAAGTDLRSSFFTASSPVIRRSRPGHQRFPVDRQGVVFSGATREPVACGLTRPHSARFYRKRLWVLDSGYGGVAAVSDGEIQTLTKLPGWTRGLGFRRGLAFVGTSRVIPRFRRYAPGLDFEQSVCGIHALDPGTGESRGSIIWPYGNQVFAVEPLPRSYSLGFPIPVGVRKPTDRLRRLFYSYRFH